MSALLSTFAELTTTPTIARGPPVPRRGRLAVQAHRPSLSLDARFSCRAHVGLFRRRRLLEPGTLCPLRRPPFPRLAPRRPMAARPAASLGLTHPSPTVAGLQATPGRDLAAPRRLCPAPRRFRRAPRRLRRAPRRFRRAPLHVPAAPRSKPRAPPDPRVAAPPRLRRAASRSRGAHAHGHDERPSGLRERPHTSHAASSPISSSRPEPRAARAPRSAALPGREASSPVPPAAPLRDLGRPARSPSRRPKPRPAALGSLAGPTRTESGATRSPRRAARFPRLARQSRRRPRPRPRAAAATGRSSSSATP